jgi:hypothetical protein
LTARQMLACGEESTAFYQRSITQAWIISGGFTLFWGASLDTTASQPPSLEDSDGAGVDGMEELWDIAEDDIRRVYWKNNRRDVRIPEKDPLETPSMRFPFAYPPVLAIGIQKTTD